MRETLAILKEAAQGWLSDRAMSMGAAISYCAVVSLVPMLMVLSSIAGMAFGRHTAEGAIVSDLRDFVGPDAAWTVEVIVRHAGSGKSGPIAAVLGIVVLAIASTAVLAELQTALDVIFKAGPARERPLVSLLHHRLLCLAVILASGLVLTASLGVGTALGVLAQYLREQNLPLPTTLRLLHVVLSFLAVTFLSAAVLRLLPSRRIAWHDLWVGAVLTGVLVTAGKYIVGLYIAQLGLRTFFGAAGALIIVLIWIYGMVQIVLFAAEFTRAYAAHRATRHEEMPTPPNAL
ncbi:MAG TPA: YihY/virulence factor BrkB family protein [Stellaceae bacterium]|nr:YihY/virulence factor BrkB family protein [Stellaceae bacterium]